MYCVSDGANRALNGPVRLVLSHRRCLRKDLEVASEGFYNSGFGGQDARFLIRFEQESSDPPTAGIFCRQVSSSRYGSFPGVTLRTRFDPRIVRYHGDYGSRSIFINFGTEEHVVHG